MNKLILGRNIQVCMFQTLLSYFSQDITMILQSLIYISLYNDTSTVLFCIDYFLKELIKYYLILSGNLKLLWTIFSFSGRSPNTPKPHNDKTTHNFLMSSLIFSDQGIQALDVLFLYLSTQKSS